MSLDKKKLQEQSLEGLARVCVGVAHNPSATRLQEDTAHALRMEWVRLSLDRSPREDRQEVEESLRGRMVSFLTGVPHWMRSGL